eukprot:365342-Chlamydomonas_euryale.AAC.8
MSPTSSCGAAAACPAAHSLKAAAKSGAARNRTGNRRRPGPQPDARVKAAHESKSASYLGCAV